MWMDWMNEHTISFDASLDEHQPLIRAAIEIGGGKVVEVVGRRYTVKTDDLKKLAFALRPLFSSFWTIDEE